MKEDRELLNLYRQAASEAPRGETDRRVLAAARTRRRAAASSPVVLWVEAAAVLLMIAGATLGPRLAWQPGPPADNPRFYGLDEGRTEIVLATPSATMSETTATLLRAGLPDAPSTRTQEN
jgi:hypothetical protein